MKKHESVIGDLEVIDGKESCDVCHLSKGTKVPHNHTRPRSVRFLENVHTDLSGIMRTKGLENETYFILFTDDFSSYRHIFPRRDKTKEEVYDSFMSYIAVAERQTGWPVKMFTLDRGGEFLNNLLESELKTLGIELHLTAGHAPMQNGVAERSNRSISEKARAMMIQAHLPLCFWFYACQTAVFLLNCTITKAVSSFKTPFELWHYRKPSVSHLRVFGCQAFRLVRKELRDSKYAPVTSEGVLVGYKQDLEV